MRTDKAFCVLAPNAKWRREVVGFGHSKAASESSSSGAGSEVQPLDRCVPLALVALSLAHWGVQCRNRTLVSGGCAKLKCPLPNGDVRQGARSGQGIGLMPELHIAEAEKAGHVAPIFPDWSLPSPPIHLVYSTRQLPERVRLLIYFLCEGLRTN